MTRERMSKSCGGINYNGKTNRDIRGNKMKEIKFIRRGETITEVSSEKSTTYESVAEAKRHSRKLTKQHGLGSVRKYESIGKLLPIQTLKGADNKCRNKNKKIIN